MSKRQAPIDVMREAYVEAGGTTYAFLHDDDCLPWIEDRYEELWIEAGRPKGFSDRQAIGNKVKDEFLERIENGDIEPEGGVFDD